MSGWVERSISVVDGFPQSLPQRLAARAGPTPTLRSVDPKEEHGGKEQVVLGGREARGEGGVAGGMGDTGSMGG